MNASARKSVLLFDKELGLGYRNPDYCPDLPFLWKSAHWCKPNGRIAMALPARTLFRQGSNDREVRHLLFQLLEVTAIVNCSNLRKTNVWPDMDQPFMLLFALNKRPSADHCLKFISPQADYYLNHLGQMKLDPENFHHLSIADSLEEDWQWKTMSIGSVLDIDVIRKIRSRIAATKAMPIEQYWESLKLFSGNGYKVNSVEEPKDARSLKIFKNLTSSYRFKFKIDPDSLENFNYDYLCRTRIKDPKKFPDPFCIYRAPLLLIKESVFSDRTQGWAYFSASDLVYDESYNGYSGKGYPEGELLIKYLQLFVHCNLWLYYALLTSPKLGFERPNVCKKDFDSFPIIPLSNLSFQQKTHLVDLAETLHSEENISFESIDTFFCNLYGLNQFDIETINDTLMVRKPSDEKGIRASMQPSLNEISLFTERLKSMLQPFLARMNVDVHWKSGERSASPEWPYHTLFLMRSSRETSTKVDFETELYSIAKETGSSLIIQENDDGLLIRILKQYRYWTLTKARLLGSVIIRNHLNIFLK